MRLSQRALLWILIGAMVLLLFVAIASAAVFFVLRQQPDGAVGWEDPVQNTLQDQIAPDLALYPLAGASEIETIDAALASRELETAYGAIVYSQELTDDRRIGRLLTLGDAFAAADQPDRAALCYQQVYDLAVISPRLNEPLRADALLAAGEGWQRVDRRDEALQSLDQVLLLAAGSPYLQRAHRRELLVALEATFTELGDDDRAASCAEQITELDQGKRFPEVTSPPQSLDLPWDGPGVSSPEIGALEESRRQAAFAVLEVVMDGDTPSAALLDPLAQALRDEDSAKLAFYREAADSSPSLAKRIEIDRQIIRWLLLKEQVATLNLGLSLVPEWEGQLAEIQSSLSTAYEDLYFDYEDLVASLPDAAAMGPGSYEVRRDIILAGRLGQYPNYPATQLGERLQQSAQELIASGAREGLYVDVLAGDGGQTFLLRPAGQFGQPAP